MTLRVRRLDHFHRRLQTFRGNDQHSWPFTSTPDFRDNPKAAITSLGHYHLAERPPACVAATDGCATGLRRRAAFTSGSSTRCCAIRSGRPGHVALHGVCPGVIRAKANTTEGCTGMRKQARSLPLGLAWGLSIHPTIDALDCPELSTKGASAAEK
jgi:hypothetical protein